MTAERIDKENIKMKVKTESDMLSYTEEKQMMWYDHDFLQVEGR